MKLTCLLSCGLRGLAIGRCWGRNLGLVPCFLAVLRLSGGTVHSYNGTVHAVWLLSLEGTPKGLSLEGEGVKVRISLVMGYRTRYRGINFSVRVYTRPGHKEVYTEFIPQKTPSINSSFLSLNSKV